VSPLAERILLVGIVGAVAGFLLAFVVSAWLDRRCYLAAAEFCGWFGARLMALSACVAVFSTCGDIR
jgi:hypothetical protein